MKDYKKFINERFTTLNGEIIFAGKSKYPVGTKIKFKDEGKYYTGTLTHPFGFCYGDVGVYVDQKDIFNYDKVCLNNREYIVIDEDVDDFLLKYRAKNYNL